MRKHLPRGVVGAWEEIVGRTCWVQRAEGKIENLKEIGVLRKSRSRGEKERKEAITICLSHDK